MAGTPGGVTLLAISAGRAGFTTIVLPAAADRYTLTAPALDDGHVRLNGQELALGPGDAIPQLQPVRVPKGAIDFAPASITFLAVAEAGNPACR